MAPWFGLAMVSSNVHPPPLVGVHPRGTETNALISTTLNPLQYSTTSPKSSYNNGAPTVNGSKGGFIGLIIGLIVLILICAGAIYYLLRTRSSQRLRSKLKHNLVTSSPNARSPPPTGLFASRRKKNEGWIQQADEFDYDSAGDEDLGGKGKSTNLSRKGYGEGGRGYKGEGTAEMRDAPIDAYMDPFDPARLPESVHKQQAPLPPTTSTTRNLTQDSTPPLRKFAAYDYDPVRLSHGHPRQLSDDITPTRGNTPRTTPKSPTFEGGTKFKEQF